MSATLSIKNYGDLNILETSRLTADAAAGATTVSLENIQNFIADSFIVVGQVGHEQCELRAVESVTDQVATLTVALSFAHDAYEPVTKLFGDKHKVYRSTSSTGTFTLHDTIDIDADQPDTLYTDVDGSSSYWYKRTFYNSVSTTETDIALAESAQGNGYDDYISVDAIRAAAGFENNHNISNADINELRQAAQDEINGTLSGRFTVPFATPINKFIADITKRLAGGKLWLDQYNQAYSPDSTAKGSQMVKSAKDDLRAIQNGSLTLIGEQGNDEATGDGGGIGADGWPLNITETTSPSNNGSERLFRIGDNQGYGTRKY